MNQNVCIFKIKYKLYQKCTNAVNNCSMNITLLCKNPFTKAITNSNNDNKRVYIQTLSTKNHVP